jgi:uncharacterized membrane protein required for colicin V production
MSMLFPIACLVLMVAVFASLMQQGLWGNVLNFFNTVTAALLATNFFEPVASYLTKMVPSGTMFWDFVSIWLVFSLALLVLKMATDQLSKVKVRFRKPVDMAGGYFFAIWTAYVFLAFTTATLHTAPLSREFMWGGFRPEDPVFFGLKPDRQWLAFVQTVSRGSLARMTDEEHPEQYIFDPRGEFMPKYATRREKYGRETTFTGVR